MGLKSLPHGCIKMQSLGEEFVRGNPRDPNNLFYFDQVVLNLLGSPSYDDVLDEDGFTWLVNEEDQLRFWQAQNGDHLMTPFQCDWCLFCLVTGRIPRTTSWHNDALMGILQRSWPIDATLISS